MDVDYPKICLAFVVIYHFYLEGIKLKNVIICNVHYKKNKVVHIRFLKQALNHGLILKNVHRVIQFN